MKAGVGLFCALALFLLVGTVFTQRPRPKKPAKPTKRPPSSRKPPVRKPSPAAPVGGAAEPQEPTDFPPPILGPPSMFPDCPRECFCPPSFPSALYCENRNLRVIPAIPSRIHYLYLQNNYISEVTAEPFSNATELKWVNLANNRLQRVDKKVFEKIPGLLFLYMERNQLKEVPSDLPAGLEQLQLSRNQISKIPPGAFGKMDHLVLLDLHHNKLSDSNIGKNIFKDLKNLVQLNLAHNALRKMPAGVPNGLVQLFLDRNSIDDIPKDYFQGFSNLAFVRLNYNQLSDKGIPKAVFNVTTLLDLHLAHNQLSSVPLFNGHLEHLHLNNNSIESVAARPPSGNPWVWLASRAVARRVLWVLLCSYDMRQYCAASLRTRFIDGINGTQICPYSLQGDLSDHTSLPRLRFDCLASRTTYLRLDGNHLSPPVPMDVIMCFRHLHAVVI